jgi:uncharacterized membrane protein
MDYEETLGVKWFKFRSVVRERVSALLTVSMSAIFIALILLPAASALYADVTIRVDSDGTSVIEGTTNIEGFVGSTAEYTTKNGEWWTLNITTPLLDTFVYHVLLPEGAQVNYLAGKGARITTENNRVVIRGSGSEAPLAVIVQYRIDTRSTASSFAWLPLAGVIVFFVFLWGFLHNRKQRRPVAKSEAPTYIDGIPDRQQAIISLLRKSGGTLTQRQIELATKLPKSSVSRNVEALRRRGIIEKAQLGMTNTVTLSEKYH